MQKYNKIFAKFLTRLGPNWQILKVFRIKLTSLKGLGPFKQFFLEKSRAVLTSPCNKRKPKKCSQEEI